MLYATIVNLVALFWKKAGLECVGVTGRDTQYRGYGFSVAGPQRGWRDRYGSIPGDRWVRVRS
jgi:hypothetical protein